MFRCLDVSLTEDAQKRVNDKAEEFMVAPEPLLPNHKVPDGALFFKVITALTEADTMGTITNYMHRLGELNQVMVKHDSDIDLFHHEVDSLRTSLAARKVQVDDTQMVLNLFKGYEACTDATFNEYMTRKRSDFEDGTTPYTPGKLMTIATNKFNTLRAKNVWKEASAQEKQIHALQAKVADLQRGTTRSGGTQGQSQRNQQKDSKQQSGTPSMDKWRAKQAKWKLQQGEPTTTRNGKTFYWCPHHKAYCRHQPDECTLATPAPTNETQERQERQGPRAPPSNRQAPLVPEANVAELEGEADDTRSI